MMSFAGMPVSVNEFIPEFKTISVPPNNIFIEHEEADLPWLKYFGFMRDKLTTDLVYYEINGTLVMHPRNWERLKKLAKTDNWFRSK